jgi:oligopeptide/dipeptide ABC transporter ATP-binding protein
MSALLEVRGLTVEVRTAAGTIRPVDGLDLDVVAGETLGLVGESGSGKSTLALALLRLLPEGRSLRVDGEIRFAGRSIRAMGARELRRVRGGEISMVLQDPMSALNPVFRVGAQIAEALRLHPKGRRASLDAQIVEALAMVRIAAPRERAASYPHQLSGGMRQRVVGAVALAAQPRLLIADEPTTSLDVTVQAQYLDWLRDLQRERGMALLFITHDFGVVARMCARVAVMYAGRLVEVAPVHEIFSRPRHWYTRALLDARPRLAAPVERLTSIAGVPPRLDRMPPGCRFAPRCAHAGERCRRETPPLAGIAPGHEAACWFPRAA